MKRWDLLETYKLIEAAHGEEQQSLATPCLRSIIDRQRFAEYHFTEMHRLLKAFKRRYLNEGLMIALHGPNKNKARNAFEVLMIKAGAHITACIQSIHALPDILANGIYYSTALNITTKLPPNKIYLSNVAIEAEKRTDLFKLGNLLTQIISDGQYKHLEALSNLSKHRNVVRASLNEDWTGTRVNSHEFHLTSFERGSKSYPQVSVESLVAPEFERISKLIIAIGHELNAVLQRP